MTIAVSDNRRRARRRHALHVARRRALERRSLASRPLAAAALASVLSGAVAAPDGNSESEGYNLFGQFTLVGQYHPSFTSPFRGANSLDPYSTGKETTDVTLYGGLRLWNGAALYVNPELDQGFGLSNTLGVAGFPSGEAYKVGANSPYIRLPRAFVRQTFDLGGEKVPLESGPNQLPGALGADNLVVTAGKFSVVDIFDTNTYAHDPRGDFLNWAVVDAGAFDYAADSWGFTYGAAAEWTRDRYTLRAGVFGLSEIPNSKFIERGLHQYSMIAEAEERHTLFERPGKLKLLMFDSRGRLAKYGDAVLLAAQTGTAPDAALVRRYVSKPGIVLNAEQELTAGLGAFARASANDGSKEADDFTEINRSLAAGVSLKGDRWRRPEDTLGAAFVVNGLSAAARSYFSAGGLGILIGDGQLRSYATERIVETYYSAHLCKGVSAALDFQYVVNPAYNHDRGPVSIFGARLHVEF